MSPSLSASSRLCLPHRRSSTFLCLVALLCCTLPLTFVLAACRSTSSTPGSGTAAPTATTAAAPTLTTVPTAVIPSGPLYETMEFTGTLDWSLEPVLVRMVPGKELPYGRKVLDPASDRALLEQPVINVVVLVHGHNEEEKGGDVPPTAEWPWLRSYKRDVWTQFYLTFLAEQQNAVNCTAFYEFIYPSYLPIFSPIAGHLTLAQEFGRLMQQGALNDGGQWLRLFAPGVNTNLFIVAHSMGGLVARAGIQLLSEQKASAFQRLVTWGAPHRGGALVTLGYVVKASPAYDYVQYDGEALKDPNNLMCSNLADGIRRKTSDLNAMQMDTPGERDLRWEAPSPTWADTLNLECVFQLTKEQQEREAEFNLLKGSWVYNENLRRLNASDRFASGDRYTFVYGLATIYGLRETNAGANLTGQLVAGGLASAGASDGAVSVGSASARGLFPNAERVPLPGVDAKKGITDVDRAQKTDRATFAALNLTQTRCACPFLEIEQPAEGALLDAGQPLEVEVRVVWPVALDDKPWLHVQAAQVWTAGLAVTAPTALGPVNVDADGKLRGTFSIADLPLGDVQLFAEARLDYGTRLESGPRRVAIVAATPTPTLTPEPTLTPTPAESSGTWSLEGYTPYTEPGYWGDDCYSNFHVDVGDGSFTSGYSWKDDGCGLGPPYYSGSVETLCSWTSPPAQLTPGMTLTLNAQCTSTAQQDGGGRNSGGGGWMYMTLNPPADNLGGRYGSSLKFMDSINATGWSGDFPISDSKVGAVLIPKGKPGDVLVIVASWNGSGGMGWVVYKYVCQ
jgi:hypothetical protein